MIGPEQLALAIAKALVDAGLPERTPTFERPKNRDHGDWSTNVALTLAKPVGRPPRDIAQSIIDALGEVEGVAGVDLAGPGFINFRLDQDAFGQIVATVVAAGQDGWGRSQAGIGKTANVEFVSANPTGPLHVGHGRWVAAGDAIANLLEATGWSVTREYYLNDAGNQITLFGRSVAALMQDQAVPEDGYAGAYVHEIADQLNTVGIDPTDLDAVTMAAYRSMADQIRSTMTAIGITIDVWYSERSLHDSGKIAQTVSEFLDADRAFVADDATWLRTTDFGDDKDRVLVKADGTPTYFAADCAYMADKVARGFDLAMYLLGADHHGYVNRLYAVAKAEGVPDGVIEVIIGQLVNLLRDGQPVRMGKRSGNFVSLDELIEEVGPDAARYTFLRSSTDSMMDFDIATVVLDDRTNPVHYINYSYARIAGIGRKAKDMGFDPGTVAAADLTLLVHPTEHELIRRISRLPEVVAQAAEERAPHKVARYAEELADAYHRFYTECQVLDAQQPDLSTARFWLCEATRITVAVALDLLGVTPLERM